MGNGLLRHLSNELIDVKGVTKNECDVTNKQHVKDIIQSSSYNYIINASAYTNVDKAEKEKDLADLVNTGALSNICSAIKNKNTLLIHYSTDYVFDGKSKKPYTETNKPNPINQYGLSKLNGENVLKNSDINHIIFRTSWVYDNSHRNFPSKILQSIDQGQPLTIVDDQFGVPNHVNFISSATLLCMKKYSSYSDNSKLNSCGLYHMSSAGKTSWYEFACYLIKQYVQRKNSKRNIETRPIKTEELSLLAKRPLFSVLDATKLQKQFDITIPSWQDDANKFIESKL